MTIVAVIVPNTVVSDSRVRKQVATILKQGLFVKILGYGASDRLISHVEGAPVELIETIPTNSIPALSKWLWPDLKTSHIRFFTLCFIMILGLGLLNLIYKQNYNISAMFCLAMPLIGVLFFLAFLSVSRVSNLNQLLSFIRKVGIEPLVYNLISKKMAKLTLAWSPDIIHAHDFIGLLAAVKAKRRKQEIKIIWDAHEIYTEQSYRNKITSMYMSWYLSRNSKYLDFFVTINDSVADFYCSKFPRLPKPIIIKNAARKENVRIGKSGPMRRAANIDENQNILLFQGGLAEGRGIPELVQASKTMPSDWSIVFMGEGAFVSFINEKSLELNQDRPKEKPRLALLPPAPYSELASWTSGATLGAIPYKNNSLNHFFCTPNKLWEYPFAGVPILASGLKEMKKFIEKHNVGIVMPIDFTAMDISSAMRTFSPSKHKKLQENCRKLQATENWHSKYAPRMQALYEEIQYENSNFRRG